MKRASSYRLSASTLALFLDCPRCFWLHLHDDVRRPSGPFPSLPGGIDGVLKTYFDLYRRKGTLPPDVAGKIPGRLFADETLLSVWRNNRQGLRVRRPDLGIELMGALDDLLQEGTAVSPLDFKTRGYALKEDTHQHYQHQLDLYAYLLEQNGYPTTGRGYLLFYWPQEVQDGALIRFRIDPVEMKTDVAHAERLLQDAATLLRGPRPAQHSDCAFCAYRQLQSMED